jgi:hypothetical protein
LIDALMEGLESGLRLAWSGEVVEGGAGVFVGAACVVELAVAEPALGFVGKKTRFQGRILFEESVELFVSGRAIVEGDGAGGGLLAEGDDAGVLHDAILEDGEGFAGVIGGGGLFLEGVGAGEEGVGFRVGSELEVGFPCAGGRGPFFGGGVDKGFFSQGVGELRVAGEEGVDDLLGVVEVMRFTLEAGEGEEGGRMAGLEGEGGQEIGAGSVGLIVVAEECGAFEEEAGIAGIVVDFPADGFDLFVDEAVGTSPWGEEQSRGEKRHDDTD